MILIFQCVVILTFNNAASERQNRETQFTIEVKGHYTDTLIEDLRTHDFNLLHKITPSVCIFQYKGEKQEPYVIITAMEAFPDQINEIKVTRTYTNELRPVQAESKVKTNTDDGKYYGMGIPAVWAKNITGKGVIIAINDIGINTDLLDLKRNINNHLSKNFIYNSSDVIPERLPDSITITDHGNKVASVIAAEKDNGICSAGIAFDVTLVVQKIFEIKIIGVNITFNPEQLTASNVISRSLTYELQTIDIYVTAIGLPDVFDQLDQLSRKAFKHGATTGRRGLGAIYVVAAGPCGNELSHNNNTISVNSIGINGTQPSDSFLDTSVLISGLHDGNNLTASSLVTTSNGNRCTTDFKGTSVAVSQVSAIIALGLQANPHLTLRDVQHLLVRSSDHTSLDKSVVFQKNAAARYFHGKFGFGLINADTFVQLATNHVSVSPILTSTISNYTPRTIKTSTIFEFCHSCVNQTDVNCLTYIEHVKISINFTTNDTSLKMEVTSPSRTKSVIMDLNDQKTEMPLTKKGIIVSVHFWDEVAFGMWTLKIYDKFSTDQTKVHQISLILLGTRNTDVKHGQLNVGCVTEKEKTMPGQDSISSVYIVLIAVVISVVNIAIVSVFFCLYRKITDIYIPVRG